MTLIHQKIAVVAVAVILLVVAIFFFGVPLTARLRKILGGKRHESPSPRTVVSSHHTPFQRGSRSRMSPRRQDSEETLLDELANVGDDKLDGILSFLFFSLLAVADSHDIRRLPTAVPLDPFLIVPPSLNDSLLLKQGLVEETTLPQPTHSAYDIQVRIAVQFVPQLLERVVTGITVSCWAERQCTQVVADEFGGRC
jgi:hypothetical protein